MTPGKLLFDRLSGKGEHLEDADRTRGRDDEDAADDDEDDYVRGVH